MISILICGAFPRKRLPSRWLPMPPFFSSHGPVYIPTYIHDISDDKLSLQLLWPALFLICPRSHLEFLSLSARSSASLAPLYSLFRPPGYCELDTQFLSKYNECARGKGQPSDERLWLWSGRWRSLRRGAGGNSSTAGADGNEDRALSVLLFAKRK